MSQLEQERYQANLKALAEMIARGVSQESIQQFCYEAGLDKRDVEQLYRRVA